MDTDSQPLQSSTSFEPVVVQRVPDQKLTTEDAISNADLRQRETGVTEAASANVAAKEFDAYAAQYESALNEGLSVSGEGPEYFAKRRIEWTAQAIAMSSADGNVAIDGVLDFGCGVGIATPLLQLCMRPKSIWGFDPSSAAIERADREFANDSTRFTPCSDEIPVGCFDLAYCNGVFHHIIPNDRASAFEIVFRSLKPGGWFAFWENNPWNPGTRFVMSRIPFDRDAVVISPIEARSLLTSAGFEIIRSDAWFLFPRSLSWLRPIENLLYRVPLGAQYLVFAQKPPN